MKILNRMARLKYRILQTLEAGIVLSGAEVKSLRAGRADLSRSFAKIQGSHVLLKNLYINPYQGQADTIDTRQDRRLLLKKSQIQDLSIKLSRPGATLVPLSIYFTRNFAKVELALVQAKSKFDHRKSLRQAEEVRRTEAELKKFGV